MDKRRELKTETHAAGSVRAWRVQLPSIGQEQLLQRLHVFLALIQPAHTGIVVARGELAHHHLIVFFDLWDLTYVKELAEVQQGARRRLLVLEEGVGLALDLGLLVSSLLELLGHHLLADRANRLELVHEAASVLHEVLIFLEERIV